MFCSGIIKWTWKRPSNGKFYQKLSKMIRSKLPWYYDLVLILCHCSYIWRRTRVQTCSNTIPMMSTLSVESWKRLVMCLTPWQKLKNWEFGMRGCQPREPWGMFSAYTQRYAKGLIFFLIIAYFLKHQRCSKISWSFKTKTIQILTLHLSKFDNLIICNQNFIPLRESGFPE